MATYRKLELQISRGNGYGQYIVSSKYRGKDIKAHTTNSECYDWLNDDTNKAKHLEAKTYAYRLITRTYHELKSK